MNPGAEAPIARISFFLFLIRDFTGAPLHAASRCLKKDLTMKFFKSPLWSQYTMEFTTMFIAIIAAFALNNWNDGRKDHIAAQKILSEISNGLKKDLADVNENMQGHERGLAVCDYWIRAARGERVDLRLLRLNYLTITRDYISLQNRSGYESLKSRGLEIIKNDTLRQKIIALYEYDYYILRKLEEEYEELQFQRNYFRQINNIIAPRLHFDREGEIVGMDLPMKLSKEEKNLFLSYLWRIKAGRKFVLIFYRNVIGEIKSLQEMIRKELDRE